MLRKTPLKRKTPLMAKSPLRRSTPLKRASFKKRSPLESNTKTTKKSNGAALVNLFDRLFSKYIRLRDSNGDGTFTCISCGRKLPIEYSQCGHFYPRANMSTRFDPDNCHSECIECNCFDQNHLEGYRRNLIEKIGEDRVLELDRRAKEMKKWSHYELEEQIEYYKEKIKQMRDCYIYYPLSR